MIDRCQTYFRHFQSNEQLATAGQFRVARVVAALLDGIKERDTHISRHSAGTPRSTGFDNFLMGPSFYFFKNFLCSPWFFLFQFLKEKKNQLPVKPLITAVCGDSVNLSNVNAIPSSCLYLRCNHFRMVCVLVRVITLEGMKETRSE